jgi:RNA polymerase sigma-70 factor (ECF subfamily)
VEKLSDISLVTKVVMLHDRKSFDLLVRKYQSPIRGFFLRQTLGDAQLSDDLAQDTFVKAYTHLSGFRGTASFSTWLYRIAYNVWYDYTRSHKETQDIDTPAVSSKNATDGTQSSSSIIACSSLSNTQSIAPLYNVCFLLYILVGVWNWDWSGRNIAV